MPVGMGPKWNVEGPTVTVMGVGKPHSSEEESDGQPMARVLMSLGDCWVVSWAVGREEWT